MLLVMFCGLSFRNDPHYGPIHFAQHAYVVSLAQHSAQRLHAIIINQCTDAVGGRISNKNSLSGEYGNIFGPILLATAPYTYA